ncbi:MAG: sulfurtransferase TusA family protein [Sphaerochaetaceae bacterium]|jgi:TusA-related sulfurtransferase
MKVDARGLSCPQPVILTKKALCGKPSELTVVVDNRAAVENVSRYAKAMGYVVALVAEGQDTTLTLTRK